MKNKKIQKENKKTFLIEISLEYNGWRFYSPLTPAQKADYVLYTIFDNFEGLKILLRKKMKGGKE